MYLCIQVFLNIVFEFSKTFGGGGAQNLWSIIEKVVLSSLICFSKRLLGKKCNNSKAKNLNCFPSANFTTAKTKRKQV